jgi:hypothetical protein
MPTLGDDHLRGALIVEDERHTVKLQAIEELRDDPRLTAQGKVGVAMHGIAMGAKRERWTNAAEVRRRSEVTPSQSDESISSPWINTIAGPSPPVSS